MAMYYPAMFTNSFHCDPTRTRGCCPNHGRDSFLDLLGLLGDGHLRCPSRQTASQPLWRVYTGQPEPECRPVLKLPWIHRLKIRGYDPKDINVTVDGERVIVHAVHEERNDEDMDRHETKRTVSIPDNVNKEKISSFLLDDGNLVISAPYIKTEEKEMDIKSSEKSDNKGYEIKIQHEEKTVTPNQSETVGKRSEGETEVEAELNVESEGETTVKTDVSRDQGTVESTQSFNQKDESKSQEVPTENNEDSDNGVGIILEETFVITSPPPSPVEAKENDEFDTVIRNNNAETETEKEEDNKLATDNTLPPLMDSKKIVKIDGQKMYQVLINLKNFKPENVSIKFSDNVLSIDAEKEWNNEGVFTTQKVHRKFMVPQGGDDDSVSAKMNEEGFVKILIPLHDEEKEHLIEIQKED